MVISVPTTRTIQLPDFLAAASARATFVSESNVAFTGSCLLSGWRHSVWRPEPPRRCSRSPYRNPAGRVMREKRRGYAAGAEDRSRRERNTFGFLQLCCVRARALIERLCRRHQQLSKKRRRHEYRLRRHLWFARTRSPAPPVDSGARLRDRITHVGRACRLDPNPRPELLWTLSRRARERGAPSTVGHVQAHRRTSPHPP
jgi:hypothetical protein